VAPPKAPAPPVSPAELAARRLAEQEQSAAEQQAQLNRDFRRAVATGDKVAAESLLLQRADVDDVSQSSPQWTPLADVAVHRDPTNMASWLLSKRASPDVRDRRGRTPLFHAVRYEIGSLVSEMLKTAKDLSSHDGDGITMLGRAVDQQQVDIVKQLLAAGAKVESDKQQKLVDNLLGGNTKTKTSFAAGF